MWTTQIKQCCRCPPLNKLCSFGVINIPGPGILEFPNLPESSLPPTKKKEPLADPGHHLRRSMAGDDVNVGLSISATGAASASAGATTPDMLAEALRRKCTVDLASPSASPETDEKVHKARYHDFVGSLYIATCSGRGLQESSSCQNALSSQCAQCLTCSRCNTSLTCY